MGSLNTKAAVYSVVSFILLSVVAGIVVSILLSHKPAVNGTIRTDTTFIPFHDTIYRDKPTLVYIQAPQLPVVIDTQAIIASYYSTHIYKDTLINLPELKVSITDSVRENSIIGRLVDYTYVMPVITKTVTLPYPKWSGAVLVDSRGAASALLRYNRTLYTGGYDFVNKVPFVGVGFNLFSK